MKSANPKKTGQLSFREKISVFIAKSPEKAVLFAILLFNILLFCLSACVISWLTPQEEMGFWRSAYATITMILDAGCISEVVSDVSTAGVALIIVCLVTVVIGMITFTGAVIGYISNLISGYITDANNGNGRLRLSGHTVILNWNTRASEIVNDLLYSGRKEHIVILVSDGKEAVQREINDRVTDTLRRENDELAEHCRSLSWFAAARYTRKHRMHNRLTVIVRNGDIYSTKHLTDICVDRARTIVILGRDVQNSACKYEVRERLEEKGSGNYNTVKALIQVADMTAAATSADDQKIVVEVEDDWTLSLIEQIIRHKENLGKCNIVPVPVNRILGQILSQFSVMPELNRVYSELFSNKGAFFVSERLDQRYTMADENTWLGQYLASHQEAVPVSFMDSKTGMCCFYMVGDEDAHTRAADAPDGALRVELNRDFWLPKKNIIILGHNSKMDSLIAGFNAFRSEWNCRDGSEILNIMMIDDKNSLERQNFYRDVPYVTATVAADIYDKDTIYEAIRRSIRETDGETSILILSDDKALNDDIDAKALTYLIYVHDIVSIKTAQEPEFRPETVDVIVEVLNPKNSDVVRSYSVNNVVMSNRYISKMITQMGDKEGIFEFYSDILTYDTETAAGGSAYESKELYIKDAADFFTELPPRCSAKDLIRAIFAAGKDNDKSICLGYVRNETDVTFFVGDQAELPVELTEQDRLIIFSCH